MRTGKVTVLLLAWAASASAVPGIHQYSGHAVAPQVAMLPDGSVVVASVLGREGRVLSVAADGMPSWEFAIPDAEAGHPMAIAPRAGGIVRIAFPSPTGVRLFDVNGSGLPVGSVGAATVVNGAVFGGLATLPDGGTVAATFSRQFGGLVHGHVTVSRLDASDMAVWQTSRIAVTDAFNGQDGTLLADGSFLVVGHVRRRIVPYDGFALCFAADGTFLWERAFTDPAASLGLLFSSVAATADGGALLAGGTQGETKLVSIAGDGSLRWARRLSVAPWSSVAEVGIASNGDPLLVVEGRHPVSARYCTWYGRFSPDGTLLWQRWYRRDSSFYEPVWQIAEAPGGELVLVGKASAGLTILRMDADGTIPGCALIESAAESVSDFVPATVTQFTDADPLTLSWSSRAWATVPLASTIGVPCAPPLPPGEVSPRGAAQPLIFTSHQDLLWEAGASSGSTSFDLHRGELGALRAGDYGACLADRIPSPAWVDPSPAPPAPSGCWFYLVVGRNDAGTGPRGFDSFLRPRADTSPCP